MFYKDLFQFFISNRYLHISIRIFRYKEIGLQPGEKLKETLKDKKEILEKKSKEIFTVRNKNKDNNKFEFYFKKLKICFLKAQKKELIKELKNITKAC